MNKDSYLSLRLEPQDAKRIARGSTSFPNKSEYVRFATLAHASLFRKSPYTVTSGVHNFFVDKMGVTYYAASDKLSMHTDLESLPCRIRLKNENYTDRPRTQPEWLLKRFSVKDRNGKTLGYRRCDGPATATVFRDNFYRHEAYVRSGLFVIDKYVRRKSSAREPVINRFDVFVEVPTKELSINVIVDARFSGRNTGRLWGEIRNLEEVLITSMRAADVETDLSSTIVQTHGHSDDAVKGDPDAKWAVSRCIRKIEELRKAIRRQKLSRPVSEFADSDYDLHNFHHYSLSMKNPAVGTAYSVCWHAKSDRRDDKRR